MKITSYIADDKGFTLLETLIAGAIVLAAFGALFPIFSSSYERVEVSKLRAQGLVLATSKLEEELLLERPVPYSENGESDTGNWEVSIADFEHSSDGETAPGKLIEYKVTVSFSSLWKITPIELKRVVWVQE